MTKISMVGYDGIVVAEPDVLTESASTRFVSADAAYSAFCSELGISDTTNLGAFNGDDGVVYVPGDGCSIQPGKDVSFTSNHLISYEGALGFFDTETVNGAGAFRTIPNVNRMYLSTTNPVLALTFHPAGIDAGIQLSKWNKAVGLGYALRFQQANSGGSSAKMQMAILVTQEKVKIWASNIGASNLTKLYANTMRGGGSTDGVVRNQYLLADLVTGNTFVELKFAGGYVPSGHALLGAYIVPTMTKDPVNSTVVWSAEVPDGTSLIVKAAIVDGLPQETDFVELVNGGTLLGLSAEASGKNLYFKIELETNIPSLTPSIQSLSYAILGANNETKIRINLPESGRMKHPQGLVTVEFTGSLAGAGNAMVAPFTLAFTPENISPVFNPNDLERISLSATVTAAIRQVNYVSRQANTENIGLSAVVTAAIIHVNDIQQ